MRLDAAAIAEIAATHRLSLVLLHGSRVSGPLQPDSDFDFTVFRQDGPKQPQDDYDRLFAALEKLCGGVPIDLSLLNGAEPLLLRQVGDQCRLLYGDPVLFHEVRSLCFRRAQAYAPFFQLERRFVCQALT